MKTQKRAFTRFTHHFFVELICAGAVLLFACNAQAQNLFVGNGGSGGSIYEFTPGGVQSTFVSGAGLPNALAL
jgi:hypothetical protein